MVKSTRAVTVGTKNTVIRAIPKTLWKEIWKMKLEMEVKSSKTGKKRRVTLLEAGLQVTKNARRGRK